jgi:hypothetical protein
MESEIQMVKLIKFEPVTRSVWAAFQRGVAVKESHFLDFRLCEINNLQVKNCQFWEFFYSIGALEQGKVKRNENGVRRSANPLK